MLKGISPLISPELLKVLCEMGHGDEIVLADANFPAESMGQRVVRADGIGAAELLRAILPLFPLDQYDESNFVLMSVVPGDPIKPVIWDEYRATLTAYEPDAKSRQSTALPTTSARKSVLHCRDRRKRAVRKHPAEERCHSAALQMI